MDARKIRQELSDLDAKGLRRKLRKIVRVSARECVVDGGNCLDFSSNNYLALAGDPRIVEESIEWTRRLGAGSCASRLISGTLAEYSELEERIAEWKGAEAALIFGSGYLANIGAIPALAGRGTGIFADKLNHNSLVNGCLLSRAGFSRYAHNDIADLRRLAGGAGDSDMMVVSDTIFSMDGDAADIQGIAKFADETGALVYLDEAHATGIFGRRGEGFSGSLTKGCILAMGTFSKALGSYGAYISCPRDVRDYLVNKCQTFIYSTALPPGAYGAISAAVRLVQTEELASRRAGLLEMSAYVSKEISGLGFDTGKSCSPIIPVIVGDSREVLRISQFLLGRGIFAVAVRPPTVPEGTSRLRISLNSLHTRDDISRLLDALSDSRRTG